MLQLRVSLSPKVPNRTINHLHFDNYIFILLYTAENQTHALENKVQVHEKIRYELWTMLARKLSIKT